MGAKVTLAIAKKRIKEHNPNIIIVSGFVNATVKCRLHCTICGYNWEGTPRTYYQARKNGVRVSGCPGCRNIATGKRTQYTDAQYKEKLSHTHNGTIKSLTKYVNSKTPMCFKCTICGNVWKTTPAAVLSRDGCRACSYRNMSKTQSLSIEEAKGRLGVNNVFSLVKYGGTLNSKDSQVRCNNCGTLKKGSISAISRLRWCPICTNSNSHGNDDIYAILSYNKIPFKKEYAFTNPRHSNHIQRFDYYLPDTNTAIEFQGVQHFENGNKWHSPRVVKADNDKREYCIDNGIRLVYLYSLNCLLKDMETKLGVCLEEPTLDYKASLYPDLKAIIRDLKSGYTYERIYKKYNIGNKLLNRYVKLAGYDNCYDLRRKTMLSNAGVSDDDIIQWLRTNKLLHIKEGLGVTKKHVITYIFNSTDYPYSSMADIREDTIKSDMFTKYRKQHSRRDTSRHFHVDSGTIEKYRGVDW